MLVGHNTLRLMVMGMADRAPTEAELDAMIALLEAGLERRRARACRPGCSRRPAPMRGRTRWQAFGHVLKRHNAAYFTHLRDESNHVLDAVQEAIDIAEQMPRPCRDRAFQMLRHRQLGQGRRPR